MSEVNPKGHKDAEGALLLADGDPSWLLNIFSSIADSPTSMEKGMLAVLYIIMYEAGFYFLDGPCNSTLSYDIRTMRRLDDPEVLLKHLTAENSQYVTNFSHKLMYPGVLKVVTYSIMMSKLHNDPLLVVNFFSPNNKKVDTFLLDAKTLISFEADKGPLIANKKLQFILSIKNSLHSFKSRVSKEIYHPHHLLSLPLLVLHSLCHDFLDGKSCAKLIMTCKFLHETFSYDETLWKKYSLREFRGLSKKSEETWKDHYGYQVRKEKYLYGPPIVFGGPCLRLVTDFVF